ncbi:hypothetical protein [Microcoleus sp. POL10_C6]|uniref:hypothetical protein n=1 Tax=unclassified Microcoleus TaxID=2642155 RepID=UPI002FD3407D
MFAGTSRATAAFKIDSWTPIPIPYKVIPSNSLCPFPNNTNGANSEEKITANIMAQMPRRSNLPPKNPGCDRVTPHRPRVKYRNLAVKCDCASVKISQVEM